KRMELATEPAVLSLGPVQPFTAGPLRLLLIADGGQLLSARVEAGYAHRGTAEAMVHADWRQAGQIARHLDPLAPMAGLTAYVRALEGLQGRPSSERVERVREAALALERSQDHLWWLTRFLDVLGSGRLAGAARHLATALAGVSATLWEQPPAEWIAPQGGAAPFRASTVAEIRHLTPEVAGLRDRVLGDRLLGLRTRGIGVLAIERLRAAGVTGPVLRASEHGAGDIAARLALRMEEAVAGLSAVAEVAGRPAKDGESLPQWTAPPGSAQVAVEGPRGQIALGLVSDGGDGPAAVSWRRPSTALLALVPELLAGQKLSDAEASLASLDLAMAEADG
ncbi:MAG: NADH-quinone oxidoreductase subunit D-related protein, partial [Chloroflexota bacterium]